jgi:hypothetical protein
MRNVFGASAGLVACASVAYGGTVQQQSEIAFEDLASWDELGDEDNTVLTRDLGAGAIITAVGWDVTIETVGESWLSESVFRFADSSGEDAGLFLTVGAGVDEPGTMNFSSEGLLDLSENGIPNITLADGILQIEVYESYDDVSDSIDAFLTGTLTIGFVPAPGVAGFFGIGGLAAIRRRR